ncbi:MAG: UvrB/UvrC motif-containing protein [Phycisphaeraceae bacterium]|nr:UvrB/UvrC motif-containing protein [Phycisphaeraceae bacterium]
MLCECGQAEATVHEVLIKGDKQVARHLCEQCARKAGIDPKPSGSMTELIAKHAMGHSMGIGAQIVTAPKRAASCPSCKTTYDSFKQNGVLGCPECYTTFLEVLTPLLERAHEGATHHVGKIPRRALDSTKSHPGSRIDALLGSLEQRAERLATLRKQLDEAIRAEQYERAAKVRDEIRSLGEIVDEGAEPEPS